MLAACRKTNPFSSKTLFNGFQIVATNEYVDVLCVPDRGLVDAGRPGRSSIATGHCIINASPFQRLGDALQSLPDFLHGADHPLPRDVAK